MDFHDFPRILGKSGKYEIHPPKLCASLWQKARIPLRVPGQVGALLLSISDLWGFLMSLLVAGFGFQVWRNDLDVHWVMCYGPAQWRGRTVATDTPNPIPCSDHHEDKARPRRRVNSWTDVDRWGR